MYSTIEEAWGIVNTNTNTNTNIDTNSKTNTDTNIDTNSKTNTDTNNKTNTNINTNTNTDTDINSKTNIRCILEKKNNIEHFLTNTSKNKCKKNIIQAFLIGILIILILQLIHNKFL